MTMIVCSRKKCMYNTNERCRCDVVGMNVGGCDSYGEPPENINQSPNKGYKPDTETEAEYEDYWSSHDYGDSVGESR